MCTLADEFGTFRASLLQFMLRSILILSRSCCIDLRTARCLRAYWTMFNDHFAKNRRSFGNSVLEAPDRPVVIIIPRTMERRGGCGWRRTPHACTFCRQRPTTLE